MSQVINTCITGLNNIGQGFWGYAAGIFIQSSVLIVLLLVIDFLLRKRVRAVFRYCLWMLLFVKLVLPASFTLPTGIGYWLGDYFTSEVSIAKFVPQIEEAVPIAIDIPQGYIIPLEATTMNQTTATGIELEAICWQGLVFLGWLVGMLVLLALLVRRICFVKGLIAQSKPANERLLEMLEECRCRIGIRRNIELRLSGNTLSPAVCGLFKPIILIPATLLEKLSREKLKAVLIHELAHIKRADVWVNLLQTMLQIVYFYNPLVWLANAMVRRAREQAVDEMVLVTFKPETKNYSNTLIDIAEMAFWRPNFSLRLIGVVESKKALERRIKHMLNRPVPKSSRLGFLGLFAIIVIGAILLPMGCGPARQTALEKPPTDKIMDKIIVPGLRVGEYTFDMSKDDVLESLGEPETIFYGEERYTLDNLPGTYYMCFDDISFRIVDDSVKEIGVHSRLYKFTDGLGVGDSEQKIKQAFGIYEDQCLQFEINKKDRTVMEFSIYPTESLKYEPKAVTPDEFRRDFVQKVTQFDIDNADLNKIIDTFGQPLKYIWGRERLDKNNLPSRYVVVYPNGFQIFLSQGKVVEIRFEHEQPKDYLFLGKLRVGSSLDEVLEVIGQPSETVEGREIGWVKNVLYKDIDGRKGHCYYHRPDKNVRIFFGDYKVAALYITHSDYNAGGRGKVLKKADIPPTSTIDEDGRIVDKIDYPFVNDTEAIGGWKAIDFIKNIEDFKPGQKNWRGDLFLKELFILDGGKTNWAFSWTKGLILHHGDKTASKYFIKEIDGVKLMFFEWKSGDYTIRHRKPSYYVLQKDEDMVYIESRTVDKIDYPFVDDKRVIGTWKSVDFVSEMEQFNAGKKRWKGGNLFLKDMIFEENGKLTCKNNKVPNGYSRTWTKGLVISKRNETASRYHIKQINDNNYLFYEWKSGDYTIRHRKPKYYVLKKISSETGVLAKAWASQPSDVEFAKQRAELAKQKAELDKARAEIEKDKAEIKKAMAEIERARAEIEKAKTEAEKAKAETERAKQEFERSKK
jgi:beta-lactamase regulating signal transducer with metallopeptidase domain